MEDYDILKIIKEDILRLLAEKKEKIPLESIREEIKTQHTYFSEAIKDLHEEKIIELENNFVNLTKNGQAKAENILRNYRTIENYFNQTRSKDEANKMAHILEHYVFEEVIDNIQKISSFKGERIPLTELEIDTEGLITDITTSDHELFERMISMGIFSGKRIKILYSIADGVIIEVHGNTIALSEELAKEIEVLSPEKR